MILSVKEYQDKFINRVLSAESQQQVLVLFNAMIKDLEGLNPNNKSMNQFIDRLMGHLEMFNVGDKAYSNGSIFNG